MASSTEQKKHPIFVTDIFIAISYIHVLLIWMSSTSGCRINASDSTSSMLINFYKHKEVRIVILNKRI